MSVTVLIPSLDRPQYIESTVANLRDTAPEAHILYCVSDPESAAKLTELGVEYLYDVGSDHRYVTRMNKLVKLVDTDWVFTAADDVLFHPGWLEGLLAVEGYAVVVPEDCFNPNGAPHCLISLDYVRQGAVVDSPGDLFHGGYHHNGADVEQMDTAKFRGEWIRIGESVVEHLHFGSGKRPVDSTYEVGAMVSWEDGDLEILRSRQHMWEGTR